MSYIAAAVAVGGAAFKIGSGISQKRQADKLAKSNKLEKYEIPNQVKEATKLAERQFLTGMPGADKAMIAAGQGGANAFSNAISGSTSSNDLLDSLSRIQKVELDAYNDIHSQSAAYALDASKSYQAALLREAEFEDKKYQINQYDPYMKKANMAASMYGAGQTNIASGIDSIGTVASTLAYNKFGSENSGSFFPGKKDSFKNFKVIPGASVYNSEKAMDAAAAANGLIR